MDAMPAIDPGADRWAAQGDRARSRASSRLSSSRKAKSEHLAMLATQKLGRPVPEDKRRSFG
jgi:hypothetical protein